MVMDLCRIEAGGERAGKREERTSARVSASSLRTQAPAGNLGKDAQEAGARRWLQHQVIGLDRCCGQCREPEWNRRGKLPQRLAFLGSTRVTGQKAHDL